MDEATLTGQAERPQKRSHFLRQAPPGRTGISLAMGPQATRVSLRQIHHPEHGPGVELLFAGPDLKLEGAELRPFVSPEMELGEDGRLHLQPDRGHTLTTTGLGLDKQRRDYNCTAGEDVLARHLERPGKWEVDHLPQHALKALAGWTRVRIYGDVERNGKEALKRVGLQRLSTPDEIRRAAETALAKQQGTGAIVLEEILPGLTAGVCPEQAEAYRRMGVAYVFMGMPSAEAVVSAVTGDGVLSTTERLARGLAPKGKSWQYDLETGGAQHTFAAMVTEKARGEDMCHDTAYYCGRYQMLYDTELLARTDWSCHPWDCFGRGGHVYGQKLIDSIRYRLTDQEYFEQRQGLEMGYYAHVLYPHNEVTFPTGISNRHLTGIAAQSEPARQELLEALRQAGCSSIQGVPIEDFVVIRRKML